MDSTSIDENLVEESEELMVVLSENNSLPIIKKAHFLKPRVTTIDGSGALLRPSPSPDLKASSLRVFFCGWRLPNIKFNFWAKKMAALHKPTWLKSGIFEAIMASTYKIHKNPSLILSLAQKWCPETNSFVFTWGEATITLEDVNVLLGFSVSGLSVFNALESSETEEAIEKLEKRRQESTRQVPWISSFVDTEMEHEAFLVLWLSKFVFPIKSGRSICSHVFSIAIRLARGERIALAPAVLAILYRDLGKFRDLASTQNVYLHSSLFKLVQVWIWERFKNMRPEAKEIPKGEPRIAQWSCLKQRFDSVGKFLLDDFDWRPYTKPLKNWKPPGFYIEESKCMTIDESLDDEFATLARCMRVSQLVGIGFVEDYYPNRVAMQYGLDQDLPGLLTHHSSSNFIEKESWDDYNSSLNGLKLYIPSRFATASVTARYRDWWMKTVSEKWKESTDTFNASNTIDHYDDGDDNVIVKVMPLSHVLQKFGDGVHKAETLTCKRHKRAREDDEIDMDCCQTQDEEDDNITIAQIMKSRKKCGDAENTEEERSKLEANNNVSGLPQKLPYGDETVATQETEQKSEENDENKSSDLYNGVAEKEEEDYVIEDEILKQRKLAIEELALNMEARILKAEDTLAKIKQWKIRRNHTKTPVSA